MYCLKSVCLANDERKKSVPESKLRQSLMDQQLPCETPRDEIDLRESWQVMWQGKWLILSITLMFSVASIIYARSIPDEYEATAILVSASASSSSSLTKLGGQFGGFASLAGINLRGGGDKAAIAIELMKTWGFLEAFVKNNDLEVEVFAVKGWDKNDNKLLINNDLFDEKTLSWLKGDGESYPTSWMLFEKIKNRINIKEDKSTGLISLTVEHYSPHVAKKWVELLIRAINEHIQLQDRKEALNSMEYLRDQAANTRVAEMRTVFYQLIEEQAKTLMLAEISREYVFKTLSPARAAEMKSKPRRTLIVMVGVIVGVMFAMLIVVFRYLINKAE